MVRGCRNAWTDWVAPNVATRWRLRSLVGSTEQLRFEFEVPSKPEAFAGQSPLVPITRHPTSDDSVEKLCPNSILQESCTSEDDLRLFRPHCCWRLTAAGSSQWRWRRVRSLGFRPIRAASYRSIRSIFRTDFGEVSGKTGSKYA
jgi:hypothetical protein